jgi:hypothetical protein
MPLPCHTASHFAHFAQLATHSATAGVSARKDGAVAVLREGGRAEEGPVDSGGGPEAARLHRAARTRVLALAARQGR